MSCLLQIFRSSYPTPLLGIISNLGILQSASMTVPDTNWADSTIILPYFLYVSVHVYIYAEFSFTPEYFSMHFLGHFPL